MVEYSTYVRAFHGGSIPFEDWAAYEAQAAAQLAQYKRDFTVVADETAEELAICAMADVLFNADSVANGTAGAAQSVSIGSVSASFGSTAAQAVDVSPRGVKRALYQAAKLYLEIYRGV